MTLRRTRRVVAPCLVLLALAGCGRPKDEQAVHAASAGGSTASTAPTTSALNAGTGGVGSPVPGLSPAELRAAVEAPSTVAARRVTGPVAEQVTAAGTRVWRVRIPGHFA